MSVADDQYIATRARRKHRLRILQSRSVMAVATVFRLPILRLGLRGIAWQQIRLRAELHDEGIDPASLALKPPRLRHRHLCTILAHAL